MDEEHAVSLLDHLERPCQSHLHQGMKEYQVDTGLLQIACFTQRIKLAGAVRICSANITDNRMKSWIPLIMSKLDWYGEIILLQKKPVMQMSLMQRVLNEFNLSTKSVFVHFSVVFPQTIWQALWNHVELRITVLGCGMWPLSALCYLWPVLCLIQKHTNVCLPELEFHKQCCTTWIEICVGGKKHYVILIQQLA